VELSRQDYIEIILDHHDNPRNRRKIEDADVEASGGNPGCGDLIVMYLKLDPEGVILDAAFQGEGCTISQAGASMLTETLAGKSLEDVKAMSYENVVEEMGRDVVASRTRCATLALSTTKAAVDDYMASRRVETAARNASG